MTTKKELDMINDYLRSCSEHPAMALKWLLAWTCDRSSAVGPRDAGHWAHAALRAADMLVDAGRLRGRPTRDPRLTAESDG